MPQSKIISSTDTMFVIVDAGNLRRDSHCPLEDAMLNIHNKTETGQRREGWNRTQRLLRTDEFRPDAEV